MTWRLLEHDAVADDAPPHQLRGGTTAADGFTYAAALSLPGEHSLPLLRAHVTLRGGVRHRAWFGSHATYRHRQDAAPRASYLTLYTATYRHLALIAVWLPFYRAPFITGYCLPNSPHAPPLPQHLPLLRHGISRDTHCTAAFAARGHLPDYAFDPGLPGAGRY